MAGSCELEASRSIAERAADRPRPRNRSPLRRCDPPRRPGARRAETRRHDGAVVPSSSWPDAASRSMPACSPPVGPLRRRIMRASSSTTTRRSSAAPSGAWAIFVLPASRPASRRCSPAYLRRGTLSGDLGRPRLLRQPQPDGRTCRHAPAGRYRALAAAAVGADSPRRRPGNPLRRGRIPPLSPADAAFARPISYGRRQPGVPLAVPGCALAWPTLEPTAWTRARVRPTNHPALRLNTGAALTWRHARRASSPASSTAPRGHRPHRHIPQAAASTAIPPSARPLRRDRRKCDHPLRPCPRRAHRRPRPQRAASRAWEHLPTPAPIRSPAAPSVRSLGWPHHQPRLPRPTGPDPPRRHLLLPRRCFECPIAHAVVRDAGTADLPTIESPPQLDNEISGNGAHPLKIVRRNPPSITNVFPSSTTTPPTPETRPPRPHPPPAEPGKRYPVEPLVLLGLTGKQRLHQRSQHRTWTDGIGPNLFPARTAPPATSSVRAPRLYSPYKHPAAPYTRPGPRTRQY